MSRCSGTTVAGLLTHVAEHTQRHVGQAISAAKLGRIEGVVTGGVITGENATGKTRVEFRY